MCRESTYDFTTKRVAWTAWEKISSDVDKSYVDIHLATKVDKVQGKGLSTNDYTNTEKTKLAGIESGANKTIVDGSLSTISVNPVQNKIVSSELNIKANKAYVDNQLATKVNKVDGKELSSNDFTDEEKTKLSTVESGANRTVVDTSLSNTSSNPVQNKIINDALLGKANAAHTHTFSQILEKPTTLKGYGITDAEVKGASNTALASANSYTDNKIAGLINGAPETLDTLKEIADAIKKNKSVVDALNQAIGTKATKDEFTAHSTNTDIHINSEERIKWNDSYNKRHTHTNKSVLDYTTASYTTEEKAKLAGIEINANKTIVDTELSSTSTNPVQNKIVTAKLNTKVDKISGKGLSANDYTTEEKNLVATISSKASEKYVDENILQLVKQRTSFVTPCFADCNSTHEAKCNSITLNGDEFGFGFKTIFSVTIKIANNLSLLNHEPTYLHIKDLFGNSIGVSMNGVKQMLNLGKYATWFFDSAINTSGAPIVLSLHTTNVASNASDSNSVKIIAHVNKSYGMKDSGVTDENGIYHTNWTPALGINIVNLSAIYPQIKELQKYRMAYATSELPDLSTTSHKANIKEICINQNVMGISLVNSVSIMVASDSAYSGALQLRIHDYNNDLITESNNKVNLSQNLGKYVTWYFTPFQLISDATYRFSVWDTLNKKRIMRLHVANGKNEGITCYDQNDSPHTDYCPAFGINISAIVADDLNKSVKEVNLALGKEILTNSNSINNLVESMEGVLSDIEQIKDNIEIVDSTVIELKESELGISSNTTLIEEAIIDVYPGEYSGGKLSTEITLNAGQKITSTTDNILALTVFSKNVTGIIKHRVLQVGKINYTANKQMSVYICYHPQLNPTRVKVKDITQLEEQLIQKADTEYVNAQVKILGTSLETKVDKVSGKGLSANDYTTEEKNLVAAVPTKADKTYVDTQLAKKVDNVTGKGLSTNDYTTEDKNLVTTIPSKASKEYVNNKISPKADKSYVDTQLANKVNKLEGKELSTNDYITEDKNLVATIPNKADKTYVDTQLSMKVDKVTGKGLSTNDYTTEEKTKLAGVATGANKTIVDTELNITSTNPVQNKVVTTKLNDIDLTLENQLNQVYEATTDLSSRLTDVENIVGIKGTYTSTTLASNMFIQNAENFLAEDGFSTTISSTPDPYAQLPVSKDTINLTKGSIITTNSSCFLVRDEGSNVVSTLVRNNIIKYEATEDMIVRLVAYDVYFPIEYTVMSVIDNIKGNINSINNNINSINSNISDINSSKASTTYVDNQFNSAKTYTNTAKREIYDSIRVGSIFSNIDQLQVGNTIDPYAIYVGEASSQFGGVYLPMNYYIDNTNKKLFLYDNSTDKYITAKWNENLSTWMITSIDEGLPYNNLAVDTPGCPYVLSATGLIYYLYNIYDDAGRWYNELKGRIDTLESRIAALEAK